jgi:methyl-accepting chemotaxis protein
VKGWFGRTERAVAAPPKLETIKVRNAADVWSDFREKLVKRVRSVNDMTAREVRETAHYLGEVVDRARGYVAESQSALGRLQGEGRDSIGQLLSTQSEFLRSHAIEMSERAAAQDERARQAAAAAKSIADLAASIERLAGEARLLAVNARIESSRLGAQSAGFEVLASEMQRLSDEVATTNERVGELAGRLGQDLPWIAQHARDFRRAMENFSNTSSLQLDDTERSIAELRSHVARASKAGGAAVEDILRSSQAALSHLQFQDVIAQELCQFDGHAREAQVAALIMLDAAPEIISRVPNAEYSTLGAAEGGGAPRDPNAKPGEVMLF